MKSTKIPKVLLQVLLGAVVLNLGIVVFFFSDGSLTGALLFTSSTSVPVAAVDTTGASQIFPNGGTVDVSDNTAVTLTFGGNNQINVTQWNKNVSNASVVFSVKAQCEIDSVAGRGEMIVFGFSTGGAWQYPCNITAASAGTYSCNFFNQSVDTPDEVNNLDLVCRVDDNNGGTAASLALDAMTLKLNTSFEGNKTSDTGSISFQVLSNLIFTLTDSTINFGILSVNEVVSSEDNLDFFTLQNDGAVPFNLYAYGQTSPFVSTSANTLPTNSFQIHANISESGTVNTTYGAIPANFSTKKLLVAGLQTGSGLNTATVGVKITVPSDESQGTKSANVVLYVEQS